MSSHSDNLAVTLNSQRSRFRAFLVTRVGSEAEAEDILQNGLLKAIQRADDLRDDAKLTAWFYRLLRHALTDHYRSRAARRRRDEAFGQLASCLGDDLVPPPKELEPHLCECLQGVVDTLNPQHAALLRRVDLNGEAVQDVARALKLTPNNASVILHRARKELRARLEVICGPCADGACLDCDCEPGVEKRDAV